MGDGNYGAPRPSRRQRHSRPLHETGSTARAPRRGLWTGLIMANNISFAVDIVVADPVSALRPPRLCRRGPDDLRAYGRHCVAGAPLGLLVKGGLSGQRRAGKPAVLGRPARSAGDLAQQTGGDVVDEAAD